MDNQVVIEACLDQFRKYKFQIGPGNILKAFGFSYFIYINGPLLIVAVNIKGNIVEKISVIELADPKFDPEFVESVILRDVWDRANLGKIIANLRTHEICVRSPWSTWK